MQRPAFLLLAAIPLLLMQAPAQADFVVRQEVVGGGGGAAGGPDYSVLGTAGQAATGILLGEDYTTEAGFWYPRNVIACSDWADHNVGDCILTVTNAGVLGFMDDSQTEGSGFVYPLSDPDNRLFIGSLWVGEDETYIANRDYGADPAQEWQESVEPDGHTWINYEGNSHQDIHACYTDSGAAQPRGLFVNQESWAFAYNSLATDLVILVYGIKNNGPAPLADLFVGLFLDIDINSYVENNGSTDPDRDLVYITDDSGVHVGIRRLHEDGPEPPLGNLTLIHNATYVWPNNHISDPDKYAFLTAGDPAHILGDAPDPDDYGALVSVGPLDLAAGEVRQLAFAVLGGENLAQLQTHADAAQLIYRSGFADVDDEVPAPLATRLMPCTPNPFSQTTVIRFSLSQPGEVELGVYDVNGRLVRSLARGWHPAMSFALTWDGRDEIGHNSATGIYFLRLATEKKQQCRRITRIR